MNPDNKLTMSFDPHTIEHLGIQMYSVLPNAIAELVANAYDAEASIVNIKLTDIDGIKSISVIDDGLGMTFDEINNAFLRIGRKRRADDNGMSQNNKRKVTGRKGLGKLAFFGIGDIIKVSTKKEGHAVSFTLSWPEIMSCETSNYEPKYEIQDCGPDEHGTSIELRDLKRKSDFNTNDLAVSLSKLFNFFDDKFKVYITLNDGDPIHIDNKLKYENLDKQIEWLFPEGQDVKSDYFSAKKITGKIISSEKPLKPGLRGITLYAHGRLVNAPEFFGVGESSHGYSYITGWLDVDFVDELADDVISTDRQSLNWDLEVTTQLRNELQIVLRSIERNWREKRKGENQKKVSEKTKINVKDWYDKLPNDVRPEVEKIVTSVIEDSEMVDEKQSELVSSLHSLIPEYAKYHWRHIHESVRDASFNDYQNADYYRSVVESIKRYESNVQSKSGRTDDGQTLMNNAFGTGHPLLVAENYKKTDGGEFSDPTKDNIEEGQKFLSAGLMRGVRNPLAHEEITQLKETGLFSEDDCLDVLSLLSHLFRRLDNAVKVK